MKKLKLTFFLLLLFAGCSMDYYNLDGHILFDYDTGRYFKVIKRVQDSYFLDEVQRDSVFERDGKWYLKK